MSGSSTVQVDVLDLAVDGRDRQPNTRRAAGMLLRSVVGTVAGNDVRDMGVGGKETMGILAYGDSDLEITDNHVTGSGDGTRVAWAPNGIQIGFGAAGRIADNTVRQNRYSSSGAVASCIIVFESDGVEVQHNDVHNCDGGIQVGSWAWFPPSADDLKVQDNSVSEALAGITFAAFAIDPYSSADPSVSNGKVVNNRLDGGTLGAHEDAVGILVGTFDFSDDFDPVAENNKIVRNQISGFETAIVEDGSDSKQQANVIQQ